MPDMLLVFLRCVYPGVVQSGTNEIRYHWVEVEERVRRVASVDPQSLKEAVCDDCPIHQREAH